MTLGLSGERFRATYHLRGNAAMAARSVQAICVEQTVEFPYDLIERADIRDGIVGRVASLTSLGEELHEAVIEYAAEIAGGELTQLLNVLMGNISLEPGIRLVDLSLPPGLARSYPGPRFGRAGLRAQVGRPTGLLLATAIKPLGLSPAELAAQAGAFAAGGLDIVKDDHGLTDQVFCRFDERVARCAEAVFEATARTGRRCLYLPNVTAPADEIPERAERAVARGASGFLVAPGLVGLDTLRWLSRKHARPIFSHPAFLGAPIVSSASGIAHGVLFGRLMRLAGADAIIFPSFGGRFSFSEADCRDLVEGTRTELAGLAPIFPVPSGGMGLDRVPDLLRFYGPDTILLIGGDLHRHGPDLTATCRRFREMADQTAG